MRGFTRAFIVAALALLAPAAAFAQASITGTVKDASGAVLPGVTVEAASEVLTEKVQTTVTDGNGRFQLVDLRPGAYVVTFVLPGFNTYRRDGITLAGSAAATVDADLRVGALEETVTVTGEAPVVDVRTTTRQQVLNAEVIDALPTARHYVALARIIPGAVDGGNDVRGTS
jgi:carboxypeptidase family protein